MKFIDEAHLQIRSGNGGPGCASFRREKYAPRGGPDGGTGGRGGDILLVADPGLATLLDFRYRRYIHATNGKPGTSNDCTGASGETLTIRVPVGTEVYDADTDELLVDMVEADQTHILAKGGLGGRGNTAFATASRRSPEYAQPGKEGIERNVRFVLKLLADVGLVGFPNAGKSTLISRISNARPKVADYPFTTLKPNLGMVRVADDRSYVVADIPGLIKGAAEGAGLGSQFLRHVERTSLFLFMITLDYAPDRSPVADLKTLRAELERYDPDLLERPWLVALSQTDRPDVAEWADELKASVPKGITFVTISAVTGDGLDALHRAITQHLLAAGRWGSIPN